MKEKNIRSKLNEKQKKIQKCSSINYEIRDSRSYFKLLLLDDSLLNSLNEQLLIISKNFEMKILRRSELNENHIEQILDITRYNMKKLYDQNPWGDIWKNGWDDDLKFQELSDEACNYIIIYRKIDESKYSHQTEHYITNIFENFDSEIEIVSFLCFKIELEQSIIPGKLYSVGYMYEIQSLHKSNGCGKLLIDMFCRICEKMKLDKIMCTVLKKNKGAIKFYSNKCKFNIDEISPINEPYIILSKNINESNF
ncbi:acetyltransferase [Cryptosporidium ryanae]|uniref:acetyltransferase n=1 Tax=Cryptosporidium ryanae TaxID=515981 RepID=UPI003519E753|nr:acetyltransferase [Cryptosporidium ryanae]